MATENERAGYPSWLLAFIGGVDPYVYEFISRNEGVRNWVYTDTVGHPTVGVGFNLDRSDAKAQLKQVGANYERVRNGHAPLTYSQVRQLAEVTIHEAENIARSLCRDWSGLSCSVRLALIDMAFNLGKPRLSGFKRMLSAINRRDFDSAAIEAMDSKWARQVGKRADRVVALLKG